MLPLPIETPPPSPPLPRRPAKTARAFVTSRMPDYARHVPRFSAPPRRSLLRAIGQDELQLQLLSVLDEEREASKRRLVLVAYLLNAHKRTLVLAKLATVLCAEETSDACARLLRELRAARSTFDSLFDGVRAVALAPDGEIGKDELRAIERRVRELSEIDERVYTLVVQRQTNDDDDSDTQQRWDRAELRAAFRQLKLVRAALDNDDDDSDEFPLPYSVDGEPPSDAQRASIDVQVYVAGEETRDANATVRAFTRYAAEVATKAGSLVTLLRDQDLSALQRVRARIDRAVRAAPRLPASLARFLWEFVRNGFRRMYQLSSAATYVHVFAATYTLAAGLPLAAYASRNVAFAQFSTSIALFAGSIFSRIDSWQASFSLTALLVIKDYLLEEGEPDFVQRTVAEFVRRAGIDAHFTRRTGPGRWDSASVLKLIAEMHALGLAGRVPALLQQRLWFNEHQLSLVALPVQAHMCLSDVATSEMEGVVRVVDALFDTERVSAAVLRARYGWFGDVVRVNAMGDVLDAEFAALVPGEARDAFMEGLRQTQGAFPDMSPVQQVSVLEALGKSLSPNEVLRAAAARGDQGLATLSYVMQVPIGLGGACPAAAVLRAHGEQRGRQLLAPFNARPSLSSTTLDEDGTALAVLAGVVPPDEYTLGDGNGGAVAPEPGAGVSPANFVAWLDAQTAAREVDFPLPPGAEPLPPHDDTLWSTRVVSAALTNRPSLVLATAARESVGLAYAGVGNLVTGVTSSVRAGAVARQAAVTGGSLIASAGSAVIVPVMSVMQGSPILVLYSAVGLSSYALWLAKAGSLTASAQFLVFALGGMSLAMAFFVLSPGDDLPVDAESVMFVAREAVQRALFLGQAKEYGLLNDAATGGAGVAFQPQLTAQAMRAQDLSDDDDDDDSEEEEEESE